MTLIFRAAAAVATVSILMLAVVGGVAYKVAYEQTVRAGLELTVSKARIVKLQAQTRLRTANTLAASLAENLVVRNALLDTAGRSTYLAPFLQSIASVDGHAVSVMLADFQGYPLVNEGPPLALNEAETAWLARLVDSASADFLLRVSDNQVREVIIAYPVIFPNTASSEGAFVLRLLNSDLLTGEQGSTAETAMQRILVAGVQSPEGSELESRILRTPIEVTLSGRRLEMQLETQVDPTQVQESLAGLQRAVILIGILLVLVAVGLSILAARSVVRPLREMAVRAQQMALSGTAESSELPHTGTDEIGQLATAFNEMLKRLRLSAAMELRSSEARYQSIVDTAINAIITIDSLGTVKSFNAAAESLFQFPAYQVIGRNVNMLMPSPYREEHDGYLSNYMRTGVHHIIGTIREVTAQRSDGSTFPAELSVSEFETDGERMFTGFVVDISERHRIDRMKNEFISTVSHELRTPLTSISGSLGMLMSGRLGEMSDKMRSMLSIAQRNSARLIGLVNDLLDMEKIQSGRMTYQVESSDLVALLRQAVEATESYARERKIGFRVVADLEEAPVSVDTGRIVQVITNLLSNAAKFSPDGKDVHVLLTAVPRGFRVAVRDDGPGIPNEFRSRIFSRFSQADSSDTRGKGGSGLGLAICKAIVDAHKGNIGFDSVPGAGATFYFDIPSRQAGGHDAADGALAAGRVGDPGGRPAPGRKTAQRVLIVEDDADAAAVIGATAEAQGAAYDIAVSAEEALERARATRYDLITVDIRLPGRDGLWFVSQLRRIDGCQHVPIIVVSAWAEESQQQMIGVLSGVTEWLQKPFDPTILRGCLRKLLPDGSQQLPYVLYVEDDLDVATVLTAELSSVSRIRQAGTLAAARAALRADTFDLVLLDVGLPDGSGLELLPQIQALPRAPQVIVFSGDPVPPSVQERVHVSLVKKGTTAQDLRDEIISALGREPHKH